MLAETFFHTSAGVMKLCVYWLTLWMGLYFLARKPRSTITLCAGLMYVAVSGYILRVTILMIPDFIPAPSLWASAAGGLVVFAPVLLLHACLRFVGLHTKAANAVLIAFYVFAGAVFLFMFTELIYTYRPASATGDAPVNGVMGIGSLYGLQVAEIVITLGASLAVLIWARRADSVEGLRRSVDLMLLGVSLSLLGAIVLFVNAYVGTLASEGYLQVVLLVGLLGVAVAIARAPNLIEGQVLSNDLKSSLVGVVVLMALFALLAHMAGATHRILFVLGGLVMAVYVLRDELRGLVDRVVYAPRQRAERDSTTAMATQAGSVGKVDYTRLPDDQLPAAIERLGALDRAGASAARLLGDDDARLVLLGRPQFAAVRAALGLSPGWTPASGLSLDELRVVVGGQLGARERQALGLKHLGYSDKEMAQAMGVKPNVLRSYLSTAKRKLGLSAGHEVTLFVHFAQLVQTDALPLLEASEQIGVPPSVCAEPAE